MAVQSYIMQIAHTVSGLQEKAASIMNEITTPETLLIELTALKLHPKPEPVDPKMSINVQVLEKFQVFPLQID